MPIVSATMPRESEALSTVDLAALAARTGLPVLLLLGSASPAWAHEIIHDLDAVLTHATLAVLDGQGHNAMDEAPLLLAERLASFFS